MKQRIALLSDVHGNQTVLEPVLKDAKEQHLTDYWFLGDLIMPGPGANALFQLLDAVQTSVFVKGNWEDCFLAVLEQQLDLADASDIYIGILSKYLYEHLDKQYIEKISQLPLHTIKEINGLKISLAYNLPDKNITIY
ncbi:metallophosphoesterase family protein [Isobaculum melis]|uniref:Calcineurin-like phosphoesterase superfamily domain-containing protein n=1 Tax=Isobaculum melis TaxID=142588 RepID=A0A1H9SZM4_9LACT|nr:metallophosphoesterase [Isobaculum melis]SER90472.1 Calcineurin-like phosphoesterase superfamily domain-containing protein [Isobaculum melis]